MQTEQATRSSFRRLWPFRALWRSRLDAETNGPPLAAPVARYLVSSHPSNHNYRVLNDRLWPTRKLAARYRKQVGYYPSPVTSLVDLSCSKGFYVLSASQQPRCERALGIDICDEELAACRAVCDYLGQPCARFENLRLHQLAERIDEFGGPFQTALLFNSYQYLLFGSQRCADGYGSHDEIFRMLRQVCSGRVIFNNRTDLKDCQRSTQQSAVHSQCAADYTAESLLAAAGKHFQVTRHGNVGGYPLWTLDAK